VNNNIITSFHKCFVSGEIGRLHEKSLDFHIDHEVILAGIEMFKKIRFFPYLGSVEILYSLIFELVWWWWNWKIKLSRTSFTKSENCQINFQIWILFVWTTYPPSLRLNDPRRSRDLLIVWSTAVLMMVKLANDGKKGYLIVGCVCSDQTYRMKLGAIIFRERGWGLSLQQKRWTPFCSCRPCLSRSRVRNWLIVCGMDGGETKIVTSSN